MAIFEGIAAGKAALDVSKIIMDMVNRPDGNLADVRGKVSELLIHVVNAQVALVQARVEISEMQTQLDDREAKRLIAEDMEFSLDGEFYIKKSEKSQGLIPYCPLCWKNNGKDVHLTPFKGPGAYICHLHKAAFATKAYHEWNQKQRDASKRQSNAGGYFDRGGWMS